MTIRKLTPQNDGYPAILAMIASPPKQLFVLGTTPTDLLELPAVAIVGSRKVSSYGQRVTEELADALARRDITIVSGLALGVDAIAHRSAIGAGGAAIAVLPSGLDEIYPASNRNLAKQILQTGGCLLSEYPEHTESFQSNFVARNRIVSGLAKVLLITEAAENSGSLHTAKFALDQGREVAAVPGSIYNQTSKGTNNLIKAGATPVTDVEDILRLLGLTDKPLVKTEIIAATKEEYIIMDLINRGVIDGQELLGQSKLDTAIYNQALTMLEISGKIKAAGNDQWYLT